MSGVKIRNCEVTIVSKQAGLVITDKTRGNIQQDGNERGPGGKPCYGVRVDLLDPLPEIGDTVTISGSEYGPLLNGDWEIWKEIEPGGFKTLMLYVVKK